MTFIPPQKVRILRAKVELSRQYQTAWEQARAEREALTDKADAIGRDRVTADAQKAASAEREAPEREFRAWDLYRGHMSSMTRFVGELIE